MNLLECYFCCHREFYNAAGQQDGYMLVSSDSSIESIGLCSSSNNSFVSNASGAFEAEYNSKGNFNFAMVKDAGFLLGHEAISSNISTLTSQLLNVASLSRYFLLSNAFVVTELLTLCGVGRNQFYSRFDHMCALMFTFATVGITVLLTIAFALFDCLSSPDEDDEQSKQEVFGKITSQLRPQCLALEQVVRAYVTKQEPTAQEAVQEAAVSKIMRQHAVDFMEDASKVSSKHSHSTVP